MKSLNKIVILLGLSALVTSCHDKNSPNYQYMPNMYESVGYETYSESDAFGNGKECQMLPAGVIKRGQSVYDLPNTPEGYAASKANKSPLDSTQVDMEKAKVLFTTYCAVCHGEKGDG